MNKPIEKLLGIEVFGWVNWDEVDGNTLQFYNVSFKFESLKKYDGMTVSVDRSWSNLEVYDNDNNVYKIDLWDVPEFIESVRKKITNR